ncbi:MAG: PilZ domain-containing protein [Magnetococcales bacterium]|nr:PilZ domain-containing protein [Magnetococcales bacterium]
MVALLDQLEQSAPGFVNAMRRKQPRGRCDFTAEVHTRQGARQAVLKDLNELGAFVEEDPQRVEMGESGVLRADPGPGLDNPPSGFLERPFTVVRKEETGYGIRFMALDDGRLEVLMKLPLPKVYVKRSSGEIEADWELYNCHVPFEYLVRKGALPRKVVDDARNLAQREPVAICRRKMTGGDRLFRIITLSDLSRIQKEALSGRHHSEMAQLKASFAALQKERDEWVAKAGRLEQKVRQMELREARLLSLLGMDAPRDEEAETLQQS